MPKNSFQNTTAFPLCKTRAEKVECIAACMVRLTQGNLSDGCTGQEICLALGIDEVQLAPLHVAANTRAMQMCERVTIARVPANRAA